MTLTTALERAGFTGRKTLTPASKTRRNKLKQNNNLKQNKVKKGQSGQASVEFLLTFVFGIGLTLLFVSLAMNMTRGYLVHYANFMASRAFLAHDSARSNDIRSSLNSAQEKAREVFESYPLAAFGLSPEFSVNKPTINVPSSLMAGTTATFQAKMTPFSLVGGSNEAFLRSESFLMKEPVRLQCLQSVCKAMGINNCRDLMDITVFDNGC